MSFQFTDRVGPVVFNPSINQSISMNSVQYKNGILVVAGQLEYNEMSAKPSKNGKKIWGRVNEVTYSAPVDKIEKIEFLKSNNDPESGGNKRIWIDSRIYNDLKIPVEISSYPSFMVKSINLWDVDKKTIASTLDRNVSRTISYQALDLNRLGITVETEGNGGFGSISFTLYEVTENNGILEQKEVHSHTQTNAPYSLNGDASPTDINEYPFEDKLYNLLIKVNENADGSGRLLDLTNVYLTISKGLPTIKSIYIYDSVNNKIIKELSKDEINEVSIQSIPNQFEIRARTWPPLVGSVKLSVDINQDGSVEFEKSSDKPPYSIGFKQE